jgi:type I restriction enzyme S subunit
MMEGLKAELEAELELRSRQYSFYRDSLLTFAERERVRWAKLSELGQFIRGKRFTKADYAPEGVGCIHYGEIYTHFGTWADSVVSNLRSDLAPSLRFAEPGDVVIVDVGETVEDVGKAVAWLGHEPVAIHDHSYAFRHDLNPTYVAYCLQTSSFQRQKARAVARTKVKTLLIDSLVRLTIPVPPRDKQDRIVGILDKFDALVNDISIGLPAEITARRRQYEHYRDRLLTFDQAAA